MRVNALLSLIVCIVASSLLVAGFLPPALLWISFFTAGISALVAISFFTAPTHMLIQTKPVKAVDVQSHQPVMLKSGLPIVPRMLREVLTTMDAREFEIFSAAVVIALGLGHSFEKHCGGSGDQGVDARLRNIYGQLVVVQSKFYALEHAVGPEELREFAGSIQLHQANYGFFVTTSRFTAESRQVIYANSAIHAIDGAQLELYLQRRSHEIALAWADVLERIESSEKVAR